jgi:hypothetical protein
MNARAVVVAALIVTGCGATSGAATPPSTSTPVNPPAVATTIASAPTSAPVCSGPDFDWSVTPELVQAWGSFWNERERAVRSGILDRIWADGASYTDSYRDGLITDRDELLDAAEFGMGPGQFIELRSWVPDDLHHERVRMRWRHCCPNLNSYLHGTDIGWIDAEGRFEKIISFWANPVERPAAEEC